MNNGDLPPRFRLRRASPQLHAAGIFNRFRSENHPIWIKHTYYIPLTGLGEKIIQTKTVSSIKHRLLQQFHAKNFINGNHPPFYRQASWCLPAHTTKKTAERKNGNKKESARHVYAKSLKNQGTPRIVRSFIQTVCVGGCYRTYRNTTNGEVSPQFSPRKHGLFP
ncbi:unnamed protein product, partial [Ectocarpus sp. 12 AP-2014]